MDAKPISGSRQERRAAERNALARTEGERLPARSRSGFASAKAGRLPDSMAPREFGLLRTLLRKLLGRRNAGAAIAAAAATADALDARARPLLDKHAVACKRGCAFCCHGQQVPVSAPEALRIADFVASRAPERRREFTDRLIATDKLTRGRPKPEVGRRMLPCPFLAAGACQIYPVRPLACRAFVSLDVEPCKSGYAGAPAAIPTPSVFMILEDFCARALREATAKLGLTPGRYELHAAVRDALETPNAEIRWLAGEDILAAAKGHPTMGDAPAAPPA